MRVLADDDDDEGAADDLAADLDGGHADFIEAQLFAQAVEERQVSRARLAKRPLEAHADLAQRTGGRRQTANEVFRGCGGKRQIEGDDQEALDSKVANQAQLVRGGGQKARRRFRAQHAHGMRIEGDSHRCAATLFGIEQRLPEHGLVAEVDAIEDADRQEEGARQAREVRHGMKDGHSR